MNALGCDLGYRSVYADPEALSLGMAGNAMKLASYFDFLAPDDIRGERDKVAEVIPITTLTDRRYNARGV